MDLNSLGIAPDLIKVLETKGLKPLPIQSQAAPVLLDGNSAMLISRTGSGKTLAYLLPILSRINPAIAGVQAVVLAPTHELAMQIYRVATELIREAGLPIRAQSLIGGAASARQVEGLKKKPHLVVGSAGRLVHLMDLGKLKLRETSWLVFDEADRLLIEEGMEYIRRITGDVGPETHFVFVSATEGPASSRFAKSIAPNLVTVKVQEERISPSIRHLYLLCDERDKIDWVRKAVRGLEPKRTLVFVHRGASAERIAERLEYHHLAVADLHGARDKFARQAALESFRKGQAKVLIASDIAARGLDISGVELVINVDVPSQSRDYLHRAGRTGRVGALGTVLSLMTVAEGRLAKRYAEELDLTMEQVRLVRGSFAPAEGNEALAFEPQPRPAGPGHGKSKIGMKRPGLGPRKRNDDQDGAKPLTNRDEQSRPESDAREEKRTPRKDSSRRSERSDVNDKRSPKPDQSKHGDDRMKPKPAPKKPGNKPPTGKPSPRPAGTSKAGGKQPRPAGNAKRRTQ